jgi:hypothetical protein
MNLPDRSRNIVVPIISRTYYSILKQLHKTEQYNEIFKIWWLILMFCICILVYLYYINISSTLWYYLRREERVLANKQFEYNTIILQKLQLEQQRRQRVEKEALATDYIGSQDIIRLVINTGQISGSWSSQLLTPDQIIDTLSQ